MNKREWLSFWEKVSIDEETGCWLWVGACHSRDYGMFYMKGHNIYAHRLMYVMVHDPIPEGLQIVQKCSNRSCVNPSHLEAVTREETWKRAADSGSWNGTRNGAAKRTEAEVLAIKAMHAIGIPVPGISETLHIPLRSVYSITMGEVWQHLKLPGRKSKRTLNSEEHLKDIKPPEQQVAH